jgi:hypothetical protein
MSPLLHSSVVCAQCAQIAGHITHGVFTPASGRAIPLARRGASRCGACGGALRLVSERLTELTNVGPRAA